MEYVNRHMDKGSEQIVFHSTRHMAAEVGRQKKKKQQQGHALLETRGTARSQTGPHIRTKSLSWQSMKPLQEIVSH